MNDEPGATRGFDVDQGLLALRGAYRAQVLERGPSSPLPRSKADSSLRRRWFLRSAFLLPAALALCLLPLVRPALATTAVTCTHDTFETVDPGLTPEVKAQHHNGSGTWMCTGAIVGTPVLAVPGPMDFLIATEGNCLTERGAGTARARIPLARHESALLRFKFVYTREGNTIVITVTEGTAEVDGRRDALVWDGVVSATPTKGDCIAEPVSAARVTGQLVGSGA